MGVCSSRPFLIHKWLRFFRFFQTAEPDTTLRVCVLKPQINMEINERMSKRFAWLFGVGVLVMIGLLVACSSNYNPSSDGLVLVGSQGSGLIETFSFNLFNGHLSEIANTPNDTANETCVLQGLPASMVVDHAGAYAYVILNMNSSCPSSTTGILAFKIDSAGNPTPVGSPVPFNLETVTILGTKQHRQCARGSGPYGDGLRSGKFLFVADRATTYS